MVLGWYLACIFLPLAQIVVKLTQRNQKPETLYYSYASSLVRPTALWCFRPTPYNFFKINCSLFSDSGVVILNPPCVDKHLLRNFWMYKNTIHIEPTTFTAFLCQKGTEGKEIITKGKRLFPFFAAGIHHVCSSCDWFWGTFNPHIAAVKNFLCLGES